MLTCSLSGDNVCLPPDVLLPTACGYIRPCTQNETPNTANSNSGTRNGSLVSNSAAFNLALGVSIPVVALALFAVFGGAAYLDNVGFRSCHGVALKF